MVEFRIDVIVDPRQAKKGTQQINKRLIKIGNTADKVRKQIATLFKFAAIAFAIKQIIALADAYTNLQNRLRVVTKGQQDLADTTERLLQVANRSRSSFEGTAELYTRVALATRSLKIEQVDLASVVETVNKSIILSGASAKEANNGLIQLAQGISSNRLGGDELRSVLEQLPVVADIIAKHMGITRGELRALGAEGKITGAVIIEAFQGAREEIEQRFLKTVPTLAQSWVVLKNNLLSYLGTVNTSVGVLGALGSAMRTLGENIGFVAKSLVTLASVFAAVKLAPHVQNVFNAVKAYIAFRSAVKAGTVVVLASAEAERQKSIFTLASVHAEKQAVIAVLARAKAELTKELIIKKSTATEFNYIRARKQIALLEASLVTQTNALTAAQIRFGVATKPANREGSIFFRVLGKIKLGIKGIFAAIAANPIGALLIALTAIIAPLVIFRNDIHLAEDSLATLGDLGVVIWEKIKVAFQSFTDFFSDTMRTIAEFWGETWGDMDLSIENVLLFIAAFMDTTVGLFKGLFNVVLVIWDGFPKAFADIFVKTINAIIGFFESLADGITAIFLGIRDYISTWVFAVTSLFRDLGTSLELAMAGSADEALNTADAAWKLYKQQIVGLDLAGSIGDQFDRLENTDFLPKIENAFEGGAENLGVSIANAFKEGLNTTTAADFVIGIINQAEKLANARILDKFKEANAEKEEPATGEGRAPQITQLLEELKAEEKLLKIINLTGKQREIENQLLKITNQLKEKKVKYLPDDITEIKKQLEYNQALKAQVALLGEIRGPVEELKSKFEALEAIKGELTIEEYNKKLRELEIQAAETGKSIEDGITRGVAAVSDQLTDMASVVESVFVNAFQSAEDALVDFVDTGKFSFNDFARSIIKDIARVVSRLLLLQAIEAASGVPGLGGLSSLIGKAEGGDVRNKEPVIVGEKGPEIFVPPNSGTIIPNDVSQAMAANQQQAPIVNVAAPPAPNVTIINSIDSGEMVSSGLNTDEGTTAVLNIVSQNKDSVNRSLG
jgi:tape measure domain-containing protein